MPPFVMDGIEIDYLHVALGQSRVEVGVHVLGYDGQVDGAAHPQPAVRALLPVVRLLVSHRCDRKGSFPSHTLCL